MGDWRKIRKISKPLVFPGIKWRSQWSLPFQICRSPSWIGWCSFQLCLHVFSSKIGKVRRERNTMTLMSPKANRQKSWRKSLVSFSWKGSQAQSPARLLQIQAHRKEKLKEKHQSLLLLSEGRWYLCVGWGIRNLQWEQWRPGWGCREWLHRDPGSKCESGRIRNSWPASKELRWSQGAQRRPSPSERESFQRLRETKKGEKRKWWRASKWKKEFWWSSFAFGMWWFWKWRDWWKKPKKIPTMCSPWSAPLRLSDKFKSKRKMRKQKDWLTTFSLLLLFLYFSTNGIKWRNTPAENAKFISVKRAFGRFINMAKLLQNRLSFIICSRFGKRFGFSRMKHSFPIESLLPFKRKSEFKLDANVQWDNRPNGPNDRNLGRIRDPKSRK